MLKKNNITWQQIKFTVRKDLVEFYSNILEKYTAVSITYIDTDNKPVFEPKPNEMPLWDRVTIIGLFRFDTNIYDLQQILTNNQIDIIVENLVDRNWERSWLDNFKPMLFGDNLWIIPDGFEPKKGANNIFLDPGLAFGTGTHPTTALCLEWLDAHHPINKTVIDYGCGSGILAITSSILGAKEIIGIDIDPQALLATEANAIKNQIKNINIMLVTDNMDIKPKDILLANILAAPLIELVEDFATLVKINGEIILSGLLVEQIPEVLNSYMPFFTMDKPVVKDDWVLLSGHRK